MSTGVAKFVADAVSDKLLDFARQLGTQIVKLRKSGGLNQQQLAARAQVSKSLLSTIENGQRIPSIGVLRRLVTALGLVAEQALVDANNEQLLRLWNEVYEGNSSVSIQLRTGQDVKVPAPATPPPPVQEAELIPAPPPASPSAAIDGVQLLERLTQFTEAQRDLLQALSDSNAQQLRHFTGVAHHLDKLMDQMEMVCVTVQAQGEQISALRQAIKDSAADQVPIAPPAQADLADGPLGVLPQQVKQLAKEMESSQANVRQAMWQNRQDIQELRMKLFEIKELLRRR